MILQPVVPLKKIGEISINSFQNKTTFSISFFEFIYKAQWLCKGLDFNSVAVGFPDGIVEFHVYQWLNEEISDLSLKPRIFLLRNQYYSLKNLLQIVQNHFSEYSYQQLKIEWNRIVFWIDKK